MSQFPHDQFAKDLLESLLSPFGKVQDDSSLPMLWILTPTLAATTLESFGAITDVEGWGDGIYLFPPGQKTGIVVIHQLPETPDTLWLRILGKNKVQQRAIDEINRLDLNSPYRQNALKLLSDLMVVLAAKQNQNNRETELLMSLRTSAIYLEQIEKITQKAVEQARTDEGKVLILKMLTRKLGGLSPELTNKVSELSIDRLETLGEDLLDFQAVADLENWLC